MNCRLNILFSIVFSAFTFTFLSQNYCPEKRLLLENIEETFNSISVSAGDDILIARDDFLIGEYFSTCISSFEYVFQDDLVNQNGDDAVELFKGSDVIETFGDINIDGTGTVWEYTDSWAYKDASGSATFGSGNWIFGGINCTDGTATIFESSCLYPLCQ